MPRSRAECWIKKVTYDTDREEDEMMWEDCGWWWVWMLRRSWRSVGEYLGSDVSYSTLRL